MMTQKEVVLKGEGRFCLSILLVAIFSLVALGNAFAGTVELPKTGQTTKYLDGDDGDLKKGVTWPNPRFTDNGDGTVTDNLTGLIWLKDANCTDTVGGVDKNGAILTWADALTWSNNLANGSCGLSDGSTAGQWRLPNVNDLESLVNAGQPNSATWLNTQGFGNVRAGRYWSSTSNNTEHAWCVEMWLGSLSPDYKPLHRYVWPVRSGQGEGTVELPKTGQTTKYADGDDGDLKKGISWPSPRFTDNGDGTVTDNLTRLTWLKNANCTDTVGGVDNSGGTLTWADALTWSNNLANGSCGLSDGSTAGQWRLPNKKELRSLIDYSMPPSYLPNGNPFSNVQMNWYWSSTTLVGDTGYAWILGSGAAISDTKDFSQSVWPVRSTCTPPPSGLVSWWKAENNANDSVGTNHGTMVNGATYARGKVGQAFSFGTGLYSYVEMAESNIGDFGAEHFTVEFRMYSNDDGNGSYIMGKSHPDEGLGWDIRLNYQKIRLEGTYGWDPLYNWESNSSLSPNSWHHIAISATSDSISIYIDGVLDGTANRSTISSTSNPFRIGFTTNYGGNAFSGLIDEVGIFNRALTAEEIAAIYNAESVGMCDLQYTLTATKSGTGSGTVTSDPAGIECGSDCTETYTSATEVALTGTPDAFSVFTGWSGGCSGTENTCDLTVDTAKTVTANFSLSMGCTEEIELINNHYIGGCGYSNSQTFELTEPTTVTRVRIWHDTSITGPVPPRATIVGPNGYVYSVDTTQGGCFSTWCEAMVNLNQELAPGVYTVSIPAQSICTDPSGNTTLVVYGCSPETWELRVEKEGDGSGTVTSDPTGIDCGSDCAENYPSGTTVTLTAASGPGSVFSAWGEDCSNCASDAECAITLDAEKTCTATFIAQPPDTYTLTVTRAGLGSGTVSSVPGGINCGVDCMEWFPKGSKVFLTASPENGSIFAGWSGDCVGRKATKKVVMKSDKSCTANFALGPDLVVSVVSVSPEPVQAGEKVTVTYQVTNQGDYTTGKAGKVSFLLSSDKKIELSDTLLGSQRIPKLSPGASVTKTKAVRIGKDVPVGGYFLGLMVDPLNTISETDESNNTAYAPLTVE